MNHSLFKKILRRKFPDVDGGDGAFDARTISRKFFDTVKTRPMKVLHAAYAETFFVNIRRQLPGEQLPPSQVDQLPDFRLVPEAAANVQNVAQPVNAPISQGGYEPEAGHVNVGVPQIGNVNEGSEVVDQNPLAGTNLLLDVGQVQGAYSSGESEEDPDEALLTAAQRNRLGEAIRDDIARFFPLLQNDQARINNTKVLALGLGFSRATLRKWRIVQLREKVYARK